MTVPLYGIETVLACIELMLKGVSPYTRAKFRMLLNKGNISREHSERIQFATTAWNAR